MLTFLAAYSSSLANVSVDTVLVFDRNNPSFEGVGSVSYVYEIGITEVTNAEYAAFLNAVAATDTYLLYSTSMSSSGGISRSGSKGSYVYTATKPNDPVNWINFWSAARFANWLTNGQPVGSQNLSTTESGMYLLNGVREPSHSSISRAIDFSAGEVGYAVASNNEWVKAAYYQPSTEGGDADDYWSYPTASNITPNSSVPNGVDANTANYGFPSGSVKNVASYSLASSYYGTFDQGGNVWEMNDTLVGSGSRGLRGGAFNSSSGALHISSKTSGSLQWGDEYTGFRISRVPQSPKSPVLDIASSYGATAGNSVLVSAIPVSGYPEIYTYQWFFDNVPIAAASGGIGDSYDITASGNNEGTWKVEVTNEMGTSSAVFDFRVFAAPALNIDALYETTAGVSVTVDASPVAGYPEDFSYQWYFEDTPIPLGQGGEANAYEISAFSANEGTWKVEVTNSIGITSSDFDFRIFANPVLDVDAIYETSASVSVIIDATPTAGYPEAYNYQWYFENTPISSAEGGTASSYEISAISANEGTWKVEVTNSTGKTEQEFDFRVFAAPALNVDSLYETDSGVAVTVDASPTGGYPEIYTYQWYFEDAAIDDALGGKDSSFEIDATGANVGNWKVEVTNATGTTTQEFEYRIYTAPLLDVLTFYESSDGESVLIDATPVGGYPSEYSYQWYFGSFAIPSNFGGTNSAYRIDGVSSNEGSWKVVVTNASGSSEADFEFRVADDADNDGLTYGQEVYEYFTDPNNPDTDGDGLNDGDEVNIYFTDPLNADSDGDGIYDGIEVRYATYGFDPTVDSSDVLKAFQEAASELPGVLTEQQYGELKLGGVALTPNANNSYSVDFIIEETSDLTAPWNVVDTVSYSLDASESKKFIRVRIPE